MSSIKGKDNNNLSITDRLLSKDIHTVRSAIKHICISGKLDDIPAIINAFRNQEDYHIRRELHILLSDIKIEGAGKMLIEAIKDPLNSDILPELLEICWESNHDFSPYLEVFISVLLNGEYRASMEAFTVVENIFLDYDMPVEKLQNTIDLLKASYADIPENKRAIILLLIDTLEIKKSNS